VPLAELDAAIAGGAGASGSAEEEQLAPRERLDSFFKAMALCHTVNVTEHHDAAGKVSARAGGRGVNGSAGCLSAGPRAWH